MLLNGKRPIRDLVSAARNMECRFPSVESERVIQVNLERGKNLPKVPASGLAPDSYVLVVLEGNECKSKVCGPIFVCARVCVNVCVCVRECVCHNKMPDENIYHRKCLARMTSDGVFDCFV